MEMLPPEDVIERCEKLIRKGYRRERIAKILRVTREKFSEIYEIARCRIDARDKFSLRNLYFDTYGLRYSTPEVVGRYRAERIKGKRIADLSCGVGLQAIFFSFTNRKVLGIDISERRIKYARMNAKAYGAKNVKFVVGNCFSDEIHRMANDYDILFSDPARAESERERKLETLQPSPLKIMERYGEERDYIFDLPPQISLDKIPAEWEKEFISIDGRITRFTAYLGDLRRHNRVAVALPEGAAFWSDESPETWKCRVIIEEMKLSDYIYIVDESLYYARLLREFGEELGIRYLQVGRRRTIATGDFLRSPFLRPFRVICKSTDLENLAECLRKEGIGKVTLRFSLPPREYWEVRRKIEEKLNGDEKGSVFRINGIYIGAINVT